MARSPARKRQRVESSSVELEELPVPKRHKHDIETTATVHHEDTAAQDETIEVADSDADGDVAIDPELELAATADQRAGVAEVNNDGQEAEETASEADRYRIWDNFREEYHDSEFERSCDATSGLMLCPDCSCPGAATRARPHPTANARA